MTTKFSFSHRFRIFTRVVTCLGFATSALAVSAFAQTLDTTALSLTDCVQRVVAHAPILKSAQAEVEQYALLSAQTNRLPNPALALDMENIGGNDAYSGTDSAEYTLSLEQRLELGGKRSARRDLANIDLKEVNLKAQRLGELLITETRRRFLQVVIAQKKEALTRQRLEASQHATAAVKTRQDVGAANALDLHRMEISVSLAQIQHDEAAQQLQSARGRLVSLWGATTPDFDHAEANLRIPENLPAMDALERALQSSLSWRLNEIDLERKQLLLQMEKSVAYPDLTVSAGKRWLRADDAEAWNVGVAVDLPLFNRNQFAIKAASAASRQSNYQIANNRRILTDELARIHATMKTAWNTTNSLSQTTVPQAQRTYELVSEGYELGRYELLYLLEVQQTLFEIEATQLAAFSAFFESATDLYEILAQETPSTLIF